jgi:hypothetical protein
VPQPPPRDGADEVTPHDHAEILNHHLAIRRISDNHIVTDGAGQRRLSSMAFKPSSGTNGGMSVDIEPFIAAAGHAPREFVTTPEWMGSVFFVVGAVRAQALLVGYDPLPENDFHGEVWGAKTRGQWRQLQAIAAWYVEIPGTALA